MANIEIEGRLLRKMEPQSGRSSRGEWIKQEFVVEFQDGNYPSNAVFSVWGQDKVKELEAFSLGSQIKVSFGISSREFNGRWYTDLRAWRLQTAGQGAPSGSQEHFEERVDTLQNDVPAGFSPSGGFRSSPPPTLDDMPSDEGGDDLPF